MKSLATLLTALLLAGCAAAPPAPSVPTQLFSDTSFAPATEPIGADDLFALNPQMRAYLNSPALRAQLRAKGSERGHFWLGVAHLRLGEAALAREQFALTRYQHDARRPTAIFGQARPSARANSEGR